MNEKQNFSERLLQATRQAKIRVTSPTRLTLEFNLRYPGKPVTTQAVRKWLSGGAIPSQDKLLTLAGWLNVSAEWLRFGSVTYTSETTAKGLSTAQDKPAYIAHEIELLANFKQLNDAHKQIVREIVLTLLRLEKKPK